MSNIKKDPRRLNLVVPYQAPAPAKDATDITSSMSSVLPMVAMMTRNRFIGWGSVGFSVLSWLGESEETRQNSSAPGYFSVGMSLMAVVVTYLPMLLPPPNTSTAASSAPAPVPVA
ncbi:uncharacterized protein SPSK_06666 [Sporothrix schenckii 1099-18]|uniref:Protein Asterix n=2 Tax=Sporothrix schenckii TaxID=29908 RepID=U7PRE0_SPOS1|nr:uncharacterized protein SPSK_06666 [Sporothrix schenckii 1099-18]ERS98218.1 hypothetical protein HMPREF1624_05001 [Sporothrix schenckii ATCC 58251]KJR89679.1 hypothetical protein SPSK_06666 [Sporothrix schenckii 1099-18]